MIPVQVATRAQEPPGFREFILSLNHDDLASLHILAKDASKCQPSWSYTERERRGGPADPACAAQA